jgi:GNAT superfamily N-acetyltransferase
MKTTISHSNWQQSPHDDDGQNTATSNSSNSGRPKKQQEQRGTATTRIYDVHSIESPRYFLLDQLEKLTLRIDDPELYYDHLGGDSDIHEEPPQFPHDGTVYYFATLPNESLVIGLVEVSPELIWYDDDPYPYGIPTLRGLRIDDVITATRYQRQGVATTLLQAIERDAYELMDGMMYTTVGSTVQQKPRRMDGRVYLRLTSVRTRPALTLYRSLGYQVEPWRDFDNENKTIMSSVLFGKKRRRHWSWVTDKKYTPDFDLVKVVS